MATKPLQLKINQLHLDLTNPRIAPAGSELEALQGIINDQKMKLANLAADIATRGLNPMDNFVVWRNGPRSKYVVLEGNRRLAALRLLSNPDLLKELDVPPLVKRRLVETARRFNGKSFIIACKEVKDREEANTWIERRHGTGSEGIGIERWGAIQTARFKGETVAIDALDFVTKYGNLTPEQLDNIETRDFITTLDRLLSAPSVRSLIGVDLQKGVLVSALPGPELIRPLRHIVIELTRPGDDRTKVTALKSKDQMVDWTKKLGSDLPRLETQRPTVKPVRDYASDDFTDAVQGATRPAANPATASGSSADSSATAAGAANSSATAAGAAATTSGGGSAATTGTPSPASGVKGKPAAKPKPHEKPRNTMVPPRATLNIPNTKVKEIFVELKTLKLDTYPHAISVLFRVFFELSVDLFLDSAGISLFIDAGGGKKKHKLFERKINEAVDHFEKSGVERRDIRGVSTMSSDPQNPLHPDFLHAYVHQANFSPRENDLRTAWDNAAPFFERIWP